MEQMDGDTRIDSAPYTGDRERFLHSLRFGHCGPNGAARGPPVGMGGASGLAHDHRGSADQRARHHMQ
jgi:hypothetical protein